MGKWLVFTVIFISAVVIALPSPVEPAAYHPAPAVELNGVWTPNEALTDAKLWAKGKIIGPEDVAADDLGRVYGGLTNGTIVRINADGSDSLFADTGGRPLGLHFDNAGNLIVADAIKGLLQINPAGEITALTTHANGIPLGFTDDLDITQDGLIIFSDASSKWSIHDYKLDALEAKPYGRLVAYDPQSKKTTVLLEGLYFANGVALSHDDSFVLVNETWRYRVTRYWLKGDKQGQHDVFIDNLPGFPDGISSNKQGTFWLALAAPRNPMLDNSHPYPWLKKQLAKLPKALQPKAHPYGFVVALNEAGHVVQTLHDTKGRVLTEITSVEQVGNRLLMGSLSADQIGEMVVPEPFRL